MSEWRVIRFEYAGMEHWEVYRLKSMCAPDKPGNREYSRGVFTTYAAAKAYADKLNAEGGVRG